MGEHKTIRRRTFFCIVGITAAVAIISAGTTIGLLFHFRIGSGGTSALTPFYGRVRISKVAGAQLHWTPILTDLNARQTITSKNLVQAYLSQSLTAISDVDSVAITRFSEDNLASLVGADDRGVQVSFKLVVPDRPMDIEYENKLKDLLLISLSMDTNMEVELESLEISSKPLVQTRSYDSFETYLASMGPGLDLSVVELGGVVHPSDEGGNISCQPLMAPLHGSVSPLGCRIANFSTLSTSCRFSCSVNHTLIGSDLLTCLSTGQWSHSVPACKAQCLPLLKILGVEVTLPSCLASTSLAGTRCFHHCNSGYVLDGAPSRVCTEKGIWSGVTPMCKRTCAALSVPDNGEVWPVSCTTNPLQPAGSVCSFSCRESYTLAGSPTLLCDMDGSWNFAAPTCRQGCPALLAPANGHIFPPLCTTSTIIDGRRAVVMEGVVCIHSCNSDYKLEGSTQRFCGAGGIWTGQEAYCSHLCALLMLPKLMTATPHYCTTIAQDNMIVEGQKCQVSCPTGYKPSDENTVVTCLTNGTWSHKPRNCMRTCSSLNKVTNGLLIPDACVGSSNPLQGTKCTILCGDGFTLKGSLTVQCLPDGKWSGKPGQCLKRCPSLTPPSHGFLSPINCSVNALFQGTECQYNCDTDYGLVGTESRVCLTDGTWSASVPYCLVENQFLIRQTSADRDICLDVNRVTGYVEKKSLSGCSLTNRMQRWTILEEGLIRNVGLRKCMAAEQAQAGAYVSVKECSATDELQVWMWEDDNGLSVTLSGTNLTLGYGHASVGKIVLLDSPNAITWYAITSGGVHSLYDVFSNTSCPRLRIPSHVTISPGDCFSNQTVENGTMCSFVCEAGRKLHGEQVRVCLEGKWNGTYPTCEVACQALTAPTSGTVSVGCQTGLQVDGTVCQYNCPLNHYLLQGEQVTVCLASGNWSFPKPNCTLQCPAIPSVASGVVHPPTCVVQDSAVGSVCQLSCEFPYVSKGPSSIECLSNGSWSSVINFSCQRGCSNIRLPTGDGGSVSCSEPLWQGDPCHYSCGPDIHRSLAVTDSSNGLTNLHRNPGPNGTIIRFCQSNGLLNGTVPSCVSICQPLPNPANGTIKPFNCTSDVMMEGSMCSLKCDIGFGARGPKYATCQPNGTWINNNDFLCEEETQFLITNQAALPVICLEVDLTLSQDDIDYLHVLKRNVALCLNSTGALWTWKGVNHLQHIQSELCLAVLDKNAKKLTPLILRNCSTSDLSQQWVCSQSNPGLLELPHHSLFINMGDSNSRQAAAYRHSPSYIADNNEKWMSVDAVNHSHVVSACVLHTNKCSPFLPPSYSVVTPSVCDGSAVVDINTTCIVTCLPGFILRTLLTTTVSATCSVDKAWKYNFTIPVFPLECTQPCAGMTVDISVNASANCINSSALFGDVCSFSCQPPLRMIGASYSVCGLHGQWSDPPPICTHVCSHVAPVSPHPSANQTVYAKSISCAYDGDPFGSLVIVGQVCSYACDSLYLPTNGTLHRTCMETGYFDLPFPTCYIPLSNNYSELLCGNAPPHPQYVGRLLNVDLCTVPGNLGRMCAWYGCSFGYKIPTSNVVHCIAGTYAWSTPPLCKRVCPDVSPQCSGMTEGDICLIECSSHFSLSHGNNRLFCNADGTWSDTMPYCVYKSQFRIETPMNFGGSNIMHCLVYDGQLSVDATVNLEDCSLWPTSSRNALWSWEGPSSLRHTGTSYCLSTSALAHGARLQLHECTALDQLQQWKCSAEADAPYQIKLRSEDSFAWVAGFTITGNSTDGARLTHSSSFTTTGNSTDLMKPAVSWIAVNESSPGILNKTLCAAQSNTMLCPPLLSVLPTGGLVSPSMCAEAWSDSGQVCTFSCELGYTLAEDSNTELICKSEGIWSTLQLDCVQACPILVAPNHGTISGCNETSQTEGFVCNFTCNSEYELLGQTQRVCQWDGRWSGVKVTCAKRCQTLSMPGNAIVSPSECSQAGAEVLPGTICLYSCLEGFRMSEETRSAASLDSSVPRICFHNGTWSGNSLSCSRVCSPQVNPQNGKITPIICTTGDSVAGFTCKLECDEGFAVYGNHTRVCAADGTWKNSITDDFGPACRTRCLTPSITLNSKLQCGTSSEATLAHHYVEGTICSVYCDRGYGLSPSSSRTITCQANGMWSQQAASCDEERQFVIFLKRTMKTGGEPHVCLVAQDNDVVSKVDHIACIEGADALHRWAWHDTWKLKNAATGRCLAVEALNVGEKLITAPCANGDVSPVLNHWSCNGVLTDGRSWFLRDANTNLYPDFGYASTKSVWLINTESLDLKRENVHWYARPFIADENSELSNSPPLTICAMRDGNGICPPVSHPDHGSVHPHVCESSEMEISAGTKCQFECGVGYRLHGGPHIVMCQNNGVWSGLVPQCSILCESLVEIPYGRVHPSSCVEPEVDLDDEDDNNEDAHHPGVMHDETCSFECDSGWRLVGGPPIMTCMGNGRWNARQPTCKRLCPLISAPDNADPHDVTCLTSDQVQGHVCSFRCHDGFGVPRAVRTCGDRNSTTVLGLSDSEEVCDTADACDAKEGYDVEIHLSCSSKGEWSGSDPVCFPLCAPLSNPDHGFVEPVSCVERPQVVGTTCAYQCDSQFMLRGSASNFTCVDGKWISSTKVAEIDFDLQMFDDNYVIKMPSCDVYCPPVEVVMANRSTVLPSQCMTGKNAVGTTCEIKCQSDHVLKGSVHAVCQEDGLWDGSLGTCIKKCHALIAPSNGEVRPRACTTASMGDGAVCSFSCLNKYALDGAVTTTCDGSGMWQYEPPKCKRRCMPLPRFYNGYAIPVSSCFTEHITMGETCSFSCAEGFLLAGNDVLACQSSGEWNSAPPTCNRICDPPTLEHGTITCTVRGEEIQLSFSTQVVLTWGSSCKVECQSKYAPTQNAGFVCRNDGRWRPEVPECVETGVPMYILQTLGSDSICLLENEKKRTVVQREQSECLKQTDYASTAAWHWLGSFNIQNAHSGRCITVRTISEGERLHTVPCNTDDMMQHWDCSVQNAFQIVLRGTNYAPTTYYTKIEEVVLQRWSDAHSYYSTFDLETLTHSSICSRRPGAVCPPLSDIEGGRIQPSDKCKSADIEAGLQCSYECESDAIVLNGESYTVCMGNGIWSSPPPSCSSYCEPISIFAQGSYMSEPECVFNPLPIGYTCQAKCMAGYEMTGNATRECIAHKQWSPINYQCHLTCPAIFGLLNGEVSPMPCRSNVCTFKCRPGYVLVGAVSYQVYCMENGRWSDVMPKCLRDAQFRIISKQSLGQRELCLTVPSNDGSPLTKSLCSPQESSDGSQLFKWSPSSDRLLHPVSGKCMKGNTDEWTNVTLDDCDEFDILQQWDCGTIPGVDDDSLHVKDANFYLDTGASTDVLSASAYLHVALHRVVMETEYYVTSQWMARHYFGEGTVCSMKGSKQCPPFPHVVNGRSSPSSCHDHATITKGVICNVLCEERFSMEQTERSLCSSDGTWSTPLPTCTGIYQCPGLSLMDRSLKIEPSMCTSKSVAEGISCYFSCEQEHHLVGSEMVTCNHGGSWSGFPPSCRPQCSAISIVQGAVVSPLSCHGPNNKPGTTCSISCMNNFRLMGSDSRTCKDDGSWTGTEALCVEYCSAALPPASGNVYPDRCKKDENYEENICNFRCNQGFLLIGHDYITCTNGRWDSDIPECVSLSLCEKIHRDDDGVDDVIYSNLVMGRAIAFGTSVTVTCKERYKLIGPEVRSCLATGHWEYGLPMCQAMCSPLLPPNHGSIIPNHCGWRYQEVGGGCIVRCDTGWSIDSSAIITCQVGGEWSTPTPTCTGGSLKDFPQPPFIVRQYYPELQKHICLKANNDTLLVEITTECDHSSSVPDAYKWRWRDVDVGLVESLSVIGYCWAPTRHSTRIRLGLASCDRNYATQHFECGDVALRQYSLHVGVGNLWLASNVDRNSAEIHPHLVSAPKHHLLDWEALSLDVVVDEEDRLTTANMSSDNSICSQMCGGILETYEGSISSPGYPHSYPRNTICKWIVKVPNRLLRLWISDVDIEPGRDGTDTDCDRDRLVVMEGSNFTVDSSHILATICGRSRATVGPITTSHGMMLLLFKSDDGDAKRRGFYARWLSDEFPRPHQDCYSSVLSEATPRGNHSYFARLVGGKEEQIDKVPWQAVIFGSDVGLDEDVDVSMCGAVIIRHRYALTAAHCVDYVTSYYRLNSLVLGYGSSELWRITRLVQQLRKSDANVTSLNDPSDARANRIRHVFVHPGYDENMEHDIALIQLAERIFWSEHVYPACLPPPDMTSPESRLLGWPGRLHLPKTYCKMAGWGRESDDGEPVDNLASIELPMMSDRQCALVSARVFGRRVDLNSTFCAGHFDGTRQSPCKGDDGGALACEWNGNFYVIGIASQQLGSCSLLNAPRYFARLSSHKHWLDDRLRRAEAGVTSEFAHLETVT